MPNSAPTRVKTISDFHQLRGLPKPQHPLISVINLDEIPKVKIQDMSITLDFYSIALKRNFKAKIKYGQQVYDFNDGIMFFISPGQVFQIQLGKDAILKQSGWMLLIHPDFLWGTPLAKTIKQYEYFDYSANEALFLSDKEESTVISTMESIRQEYHTNIDKYSQNIIIAQIELMLSYAERFYNRQFITRKITNHQILDRLESIFDDYFNSAGLSKQGLPTVQYVAGQLNVSPNYLSGLLKTLTGQSTQQHIHQKLLEKAKEQLSNTNLSVSEIAYQLGFEHPQSFNKLFKAKANVSPLGFRQSFN